MLSQMLLHEIERLGLFDPLYKTREREIRFSLEP